MLCQKCLQLFSSNTFKGSPTGCATVNIGNGVRIAGCEGENRNTHNAAAATTRNLVSSTTHKMPFGIPPHKKRPYRPYPPERNDNRTDDNNSTTTEMPPGDNANDNTNGFPWAATLSIVIPTTVAIIGGRLIYIQWKKNRGVTAGSVPYRRSTERLRNSDENISDDLIPSGGSNNEVNTENIPIENIGAASSVIAPNPLICPPHSNYAFNSQGASISPSKNPYLDPSYSRNASLDPFQFDPNLTHRMTRSTTRSMRQADTNV